MDPTAVSNYRNIMVHGGIALLLLLEGIGLNHIPIRISQQWYFFLACLLFFFWTLLHTFLGIGDPSSEDDDVIYMDLNWLENPLSASLLASLAIFVVSPMSFLFVWLLSLYSRPFCFQGLYRTYEKPTTDVKEIFLTSWEEPEMLAEITPQGRASF
jgi:hypothetical protein